MSFEKAMEILEEYEKGVPPRTAASLACCAGCGGDKDSVKKCTERSILEIKSLHVKSDGKEIVKGISLIIKQGEVHVLMGPNGAGKSTLVRTIAGHPKCTVTKGSITFDEEDLLAMSVAERARKGIFLAFQQPIDVQGVTLGTMLFHAYKARYGSECSIGDFNKDLNEALALLQLDRSFIDRQLNVGLSGGERKRTEMLQLLVLRPAFALLDETDSGLDIDSLKIVNKAFETLRGPCMGVLLVTHSPKIAGAAKPDIVHVMLDGKIMQSGTVSLLDQLEKKGYSWLKPGLKIVS